MDAMLRGPDGSGKCDLFLSFSPSVSYQQHPSEVHARAAYGANNFTDGQDSALNYPPKLQKRQRSEVFAVKKYYVQRGGMFSTIALASRRNNIHAFRMCCFVCCEPT